MGLFDGIKKTLLQEVPDDTAALNLDDSMELLNQVRAEPGINNGVFTVTPGTVQELLDGAYAGIGDDTALNQLSGLMSIFEELPQETKRKKVLETLKNFGVSVESIIQDGEQRKAAVQHTLDEEKGRVTADNEQLTATIEDLREKIAAAQKTITENRAYLESTETGLSAEIARLEQIIAFAQSIIPAPDASTN